MALVSYGSSGESDMSDTEDVEPQSKVSFPPAKPTRQESISGHISEDDDDWARQEGPDLEDLDIPGLSTSRSLFSYLPQISKTAIQKDDSNVKNFIDENEDLSTIPARKEYEKEAPVIPTVKTKKGPVRIFAPIISNDSDDEDAPIKRFVPRPTAGKKSTLLSLIPAPKNAAASQSSQSSAPSTSSVAKTSSLVPRSVARPPVKTVKASSSKAQDSSDDEVDSGSFFTFEKDNIPPTQVNEPTSFTSKIPTVQTTPDIPEFEPCYKPNDDEIYGSAIAPYPPPPPTVQTVADDGLLEDQEAMQRIIGRKAKIGDINFVEVNNDDIKPDPRDWMVKALSEDKDGQPGPKNTIKGERKRKHQITYLAAMAKEQEHVLKQQWSQNAHTRRATQSKYGF